MQNLNAALLVCQELGIQKSDFYKGLDIATDQIIEILAGNFDSIKETKSERAKLILDEFDRYEPSFWLVSPAALNIQDLLKATTANAA